MSEKCDHKVGYGSVNDWEDVLINKSDLKPAQCIFGVKFDFCPECGVDFKKANSNE